MFCLLGSLAFLLGSLAFLLGPLVFLLGPLVFLLCQLLRCWDNDPFRRYPPQALISHTERETCHLRVDGALCIWGDLLVLQAVQTIDARLHARIGDIPTPDYVRTKRFLIQLDDAIKLLREPDAGKYFNQTYAARGKTVAELIRYMTQLDLHFAPAVEGDEAAYAALQHALASYDVGLQGMITKE